MQFGSAVALDGTFEESATHLRWPSVACLDRDGKLEWAHFHGGDILEVALGEDQSVATICPPRRRGVREWERLDALTGV